jgi:predicted  nucleic acid-binding Zn-ribbon protein
MTPTELVSRDPGTLTAHEHRIVTAWMTTETEIKQLTHRLAEARERLRQLRTEIEAIGAVTA